jgi:hypothetical protein
LKEEPTGNGANGATWWSVSSVLDFPGSPDYLKPSMKDVEGKKEGANL